MVSAKISITTDGGSLLPSAIHDLVSYSDLANSGYQLAHYTVSHLVAPTEGALSARLEVSLPGNALVDAVVLKITARRADRAEAGRIAQLRGEAGDLVGRFVVTVDFGTVRTAAAVDFDIDCFVEMVEAWNGTEFPAIGSKPFYSNFSSIQPTGQSFVRFQSDTRTERLRITVRGNTTAEALMGALFLVLPDAPKDLTLRIDSGAPVWSLPGPAVPGTEATLTTDAWNNTGERLVDLGAEFAARTGDPADTVTRTFEVLLESREAGVLKIALHALDHRYLGTATLGGETRLRLAPEAEGGASYVIDGAPGGASVQSLSVTATGAYPAERRIPPTGPEPLPSEDPAVALVELDLTPRLSAILRLAATEGIPAYVGLRLLLGAGSGGAEFRLVPWTNAEPALSAPGAALEDLTGQPVTLAEGAPGWVGALFGGALVIDPTNPPWVALHVARGTVTFGLCDMGAGLRVGPAAGPWRRLPPLYEGFGMPHRTIGAAEDPSDPAPVSLAVNGSAIKTLDPRPEGLRLVFDGLTAAAPVLEITHYGPGELTLSESVIVYDIPTT